MLYEYLNEHFGPNDTGTVVNAATGKAVPPPPAGRHSTLSPSDMAPAWRGPPPRKDARGDRPLAFPSVTNVWAGPRSARRPSSPRL
jgi:hypothetical protein